MEDDRTYFTRRALEERSAADKAGNRKAREAHSQMAKSYEERAQARTHEPAQEPAPVATVA
jgi:hypothetical protein